MSEVEACHIEFTAAARMARIGGRFAIYDVVTDDAGSVIRLNRRIVEGREHVPKMVRLDQFESCIRRWRFNGRGDFLVSLVGGWRIEVTRDSQKFLLHVPVTRSRVDIFK